MAKLYKDLGLFFIILVSTISVTFFVAEANAVEREDDEGIKSNPYFYNIFPLIVYLVSLYIL